MRAGLFCASIALEAQPPAEITRRGLTESPDMFSAHGTTAALANAVEVLSRELSSQHTAREYGLDWRNVATIVKRAVKYGLEKRARPPVHAIGIDEVSRRTGQVYLTVVYDLERRVWLWVGEDRNRRGREEVLHRGDGSPGLSCAPDRVHAVKLATGGQMTMLESRINPRREDSMAGCVL